MLECLNVFFSMYIPGPKDALSQPFGGENLRFQQSVSLGGSKPSKSWVFPNIGVPKSSILIGFSLINHPFWGFHSIFGNTQLETFSLGDLSVLP